MTGFEKSSGETLGSEEARASSSAAPRSRTKRRLFAAFTASVPLLAFVALEATLRLAGFGSGYPLFVAADSAGKYGMMNPLVGHRYFFGEAIVPGVTRDVFLREKTPDTYRIVVQGGSSALGYPYFYGGAFPRMLERRLQRTFPERDIEVVNTGMTAVMSYTLRDFADEIVEIEPDAVLIYAGHNEYYGVFGVGSSLSVGGSPTFIRTYLALRRLRTVQLLRAGLTPIRRVLGSGPEEASPRTQMERMVKERTIPYGSPLYRRGVERFRANLEDLLERYRREGIPVFVATLVSNERDQPPFISSPQPGVEEGEWEAAVRAALGALEAGDTAAVRRGMGDLVGRDSTNAEAFFTAARSVDRAGAYSLARELYLGAKDRDQLRFRAPEAMNAVIRETAERAGATVVDVQSFFAAESPDGIPGRTLLTEHLHPRLEGYFLMADAFYEALRRAGEIGSWEAVIPRDEARRDPPYTAVDSLHGELQIRALTAGWPFHSGDPPSSDPPARGGSDGLRADAGEDLPQRLARALYRREMTWPGVTYALYRHYESAGAFDLARRTARALSQEFPDLPTPYELWGMAALRAGDPEEAASVLEKAYAIQRRHHTAAMLGSALLAAGDRERALRHLEEAADLAPPDEPVPRAALSAARALPALERAVAERPRDPERLYDLAAAYAAVNQVERARALLERALAVAPSNAPARTLLERLQPGGGEPTSGSEGGGAEPPGGVEPTRGR